MMYGGVQMNADHLLANSDVTEMSQMISALIQNGYFAEDVTEMVEGASPEERTLFRTKMQTLMSKIQ